MQELTKELDRIATQLELSGQKKLAMTLDVVSNELDKIAMAQREAAFLQGITDSVLRALPDSIASEVQRLVDEKFRGRGGKKIDLGEISTIAIEENESNPAGVIIMTTDGQAVEPMDAEGDEIEDLKENIQRHGRPGAPQ